MWILVALAAMGLYWWEKHVKIAQAAVIASQTQTPALPTGPAAPAAPATPAASTTVTPPAPPSATLTAIATTTYKGIVVTLMPPTASQPQWMAVFVIPYLGGAVPTASQLTPPPHDVYGATSAAALAAAQQVIDAAGVGGPPQPSVPPGPPGPSVPPPNAVSVT